MHCVASSWNNSHTDVHVTSLKSTDEKNNQWCRNWRWRECKCTPKISDLSKIWAKNLRHFLQYLWNYVLVIECMNKVYCVTENILNTHKINKLFLITSTFSLWGLMSSWLTWKFWQKKAFHLYALQIVHWGIRVYCMAPASYQYSPCPAST